MSLATLLPEATRNARIQLRPKRMLAAAVISAAASIAAYISYSHPLEPKNLLEFLLGAQATALTIGGGIYCLLSIHREKDLNTFDYQCITRLKPLELALGKLFGAPSLLYFIILCLVPVTLIAAILSKLSVVTVLSIYTVLLLSSITWHSFALLVSLVVRRGASAGAIIFFLLLVGMSFGLAGNRGTLFGWHNIGPFYVTEMANPFHYSSSWQQSMELPVGRDLFLGIPVSDILVLSVLYLSLTGWFLLGLRRNIKRDPAIYEVYSPAQAFGFMIYLQLFMLAFFQWSRIFWSSTNNIDHFDEHWITPLQAENEILVISLWLFAVFALTLLRNREHVRRRILELGKRATGWWASVWPAPYLLGGVLAVGLTIIALIVHKLHPAAEWSFGMAFFEVCFLAAWLTRDAIYLQWMNVRRGRNSLVAGIIYMIVFYVCSSALFAGFISYLAGFHAASAYLEPCKIFDMNFNSWTGYRGIWLGALLLLAFEALLFTALHHRQLTKLRDSAAV
jgi:hypothetical protein